MIAGASSAFYGPNAFNGVISMETKSPFLFPGIMAEIKVGEREMGQVQFRIADYFSNENGEQKFGYKLTASYMQANDWEAENYQPTEDSDFDICLSISVLPDLSSFWTKFILALVYFEDAMSTLIKTSFWSQKV